MNSNVINLTSGADRREVEQVDAATRAKAAAGIAALRRKNAEERKVQTKTTAAQVINKYQAALDRGERMFILEAEDLRALIEAAQS